MKSRNYLIYSVVLLGTILISCVKQITISKVPASGDMVISSVLIAGELIRVAIDFTIPIDEEFTFNPNDCDVYLLRDHVPVDTLQYQENGIYISEVIAEVNLGYRVEVHYGSNIISGEDVVPPAPLINKIEQTKVESGDDFGDDFINTFITIGATDSIQYYEIERFSIRCGQEDCGIDHLLLGPNQDPVIISEGLQDFESKYVIFSNSSFIGKEYTLLHQVLSTIAAGSTKIKNNKSLDNGRYLKVATLSDSAYKFRRSLIQYHHNLNTGAKVNDFKSLLFGAEPSPLYSNTTNNRGIVVAMSEEFYLVQY